MSTKLAPVSRSYLKHYASCCADASAASEQHILECIDYYMERDFQLLNVDFEEFICICIRYMEYTRAIPSSFLTLLHSLYTAIEYQSLKAIAAGLRHMLEMAKQQPNSEDLKDFIVNHSFGVRNARLLWVIMDGYEDIFVN